MNNTLLLDICSIDVRVSSRPGPNLLIPVSLNLKLRFRLAHSFLPILSHSIYVLTLLGKDEWKNQQECKDYDYGLIKERLQVLRTIRKNGDIPAMIFNLRTSLARNLGDMGNPKVLIGGFFYNS